jgi:hypothetical protein
MFYFTFWTKVIIKFIFIESFFADADYYLLNDTYI